MEIYQRQKDITMNTNIKVGIVGLGGVGFWAAKFMAMSGVNDFQLFDNDIIEIHNLNRLDLPMSAIGKNKADVAKSVINHIRPDANVRSVPFLFKGDYLSGKVDLILDCTDKVESQKMVQSYAKDKKIKYVKVGYDGTHITVANKVATWGESQGGYVITPSWVVPAAMVAAMAVGAVLKYFDCEVSADIYNLYGLK
jgi:tRNA A37 threonylcarbamoyladenosine dehydratase